MRKRFLHDVWGDRKTLSSVSVVTMGVAVSGHDLDNGLSRAQRIIVSDSGGCLNPLPDPEDFCLIEKFALLTKAQFTQDARRHPHANWNIFFL